MTTGRPSTNAVAYAAIAQDPRLHSRARHTQAALIDAVMEWLHVSRVTARVIVHRARRNAPTPDRYRRARVVG